MSRLIDALVATEIMGFETANSESGMATKNVQVHSLPHYSTNIAAAWEVVEKTDLLSKYEMYSFGGKWFLQENYYTPFIEEAPTAPMAICLAALKARGIDVEGETLVEVGE